MADTLNVSDQSGAGERITSIRDRVEELLEKRAQALLDGGPQSSAVLEITANLIEITAFCERMGIGVVTQESMARRVEATKEPFDEKVDAICRANNARFWRQMEEMIAEEERVKAEKWLPLELAKRRLELRKAAIAKRAAEEGLKTIHLIDSENPEDCELVYRGPVFRVINASKFTGPSSGNDGLGGETLVNGDAGIGEQSLSSFKQRVWLKFPYNPFLLSTYTFGKHRSCFQEMPHADRDFMVGLRVDPANDCFSVKAIDPRVTIRKKESSGFSFFMESTYPFDEGDVVRMEQNHLVVERDHGFSMGALYAEAKAHLIEMVEIIFDTDTTTLAQNLEAFRNIVRILDCNLPQEKLDKLRNFVSILLGRNVNIRFQEIKSWDALLTERDARKFVPLMMLITENSRPDATLHFKTDISIEDLKEEAGRRINRYLMLEDTHGGGEVEIARFIEAELVDMNDLMLDRKFNISNRVERVMKIRALIDALYSDDLNQLVEIQKLAAEAQGVKLAQIYGDDEIRIRDQDIDLKLKGSLPVIPAEFGQDSYVSQIARKIARNAFRKLKSKRTAEEKKNDLLLIRSLMDMGMVKTIHLVEFGDLSDLTARQEEIEEMLEEFEEGIVSSLQREELRKKEQLQARELAHVAFREEYERRSSLLERSLQMVCRLNNVRSLIGLEELYYYLDNADLMLGEDAENVIGTMMMTALEEPISDDLQDYEGRMTRLVLEVKPMKSNWSDIRNKWRMVVDRNLRACLQRSLQGKDVGISVFMLEKASHWDAEWSELFEQNRQVLQAAREREQFVIFQPVVLRGVDPQDQVPAWLQAPDVQKYIRQVDRIRLKMASDWFRDLVKRMNGGHDNERYQKLMRNLVTSVPTLRLSLSEEELALLQSL